MSDIPPPPPPPPDDEIPPPPPPPEEADEADEDEEILGAEIDFEKLAARAAKIAARANQRQQTLPPSSDETKKKNKRKRENAEVATTTTTTTTATMPAPPVKTVLDEVDEKRMEDGDRVWGIALSSCSEYPNKKYFFSRQDSRAERVCQWETPKELKGGLQKNLRICPLKATLLAQNTMPESGWVELTTSVPVCDDDDEEQDKERERERDKESGAKKNKNKTTRSAKYYWHPATKRVTWTRPRRDESEVSEAEILPLAGPLR